MSKLVLQSDDVKIAIIEAATSAIIAAMENELFRVDTLSDESTGDLVGKEIARAANHIADVVSD